MKVRSVHLCMLTLWDLFLSIRNWLCIRLNASFEVFLFSKLFFSFDVNEFLNDMMKLIHLLESSVLQHHLLLTVLTDVSAVFDDWLQLSVIRLLSKVRSWSELSHTNFCPSKSWCQQKLLGRSFPVFYQTVLLSLFLITYDRARQNLFFFYYFSHTGGAVPLFQTFGDKVKGDHGRWLKSSKPSFDAFI